jgi:hypothetical protein
VRGLWWLRSFGARSTKSKALTVTLTVVAVGLTIGLGTWGSGSLDIQPKLGVPLALYRAVRLYTLDLGPAAGGNGAPRPNWQLWVAFALAAALVLRGALLLWRERIRRLVTRYALRRHIIVCGGGVHGTRLVHELADDHDVVLIDIDPNALGMLAPRGKHEWRLVGDCVREETLIAAGVARANWVVAIPGHDFVSSQVVSAVRSLAKSRRVRDRAHVLAQVEDPVLARFLEEEQELAHGVGEPSGSAPSPGKMPSPVVSPFSANAIAAETLLDESEVAVGGSGELGTFLQMHDGKAPNLLLAGDHPLLDAVVLATLRRWRVRVLRELESTSPHHRPPLHVSVIGRGAVARVEGFYARWGPEPEVLTIEARDIDGSPGSLDSAEDWLGKPDRADHAVVCCLDELDAVRLTLELSRALGGRARMTRVTAQPQSALDAHLEERTSRSDELAPTSVKSLADLACRPAVMGRLEGPQRLADALARDSSAGNDPAAVTAELYERANALGLRSDSAWRARPCERPLLTALLYPVPLSALVRAGLKVELARPSNLRYAAERLSADGSPAAFAAWCEYLRHAGPDDEEEARAEPPADGNANLLIRLRRAALGDGEALTGLSPDGLVLVGAPRVAIIAGAAGSMRASAGGEIARLLWTGLRRYDGVVLAGGTAAGVPGIVGAVAREHGLSHHVVGYTPEGRADRRLYPVIRETPGATEFSVREPLAMWTDIMRARTPIGNVRVLAFPGQEITINEMLAARALGAKVAFVDPTGESSGSLDDVLPLGAGGIIEIPSDPMTVRAFLKWSQLPPERREAVARHIHNEYRRKGRGRKAPTDPAMAPWEDLLPSLKDSNLSQADDIPNKLDLIGKKISPEGHPLELTPEEALLLAEAEHGRWNIERLTAGWRLGDRDVRRAVSPHLKPWAELDDEARAYDLEAVAGIGPALAEAGWGVVEITASDSPNQVPPD